MSVLGETERIGNCVCNFKSLQYTGWPALVLSLGRVIKKTTNRNEKQRKATGKHINRKEGHGGRMERELTLPWLLSLEVKPLL